MLELSGVPPSRREKDAGNDSAIETALARGSIWRSSGATRTGSTTGWSAPGSSAKAPVFAWDAYFVALGYPGVTAINVAVPGFFAA